LNHIKILEMENNKIKSIIGLGLGVVTALIGLTYSNDLVVIAAIGIIIIESWDLI